MGCRRGHISVRRSRARLAAAASIAKPSPPPVAITNKLTTSSLVQGYDLSSSVAESICNYMRSETRIWNHHQQNQHPQAIFYCPWVTYRWWQTFLNAACLFYGLPVESKRGPATSAACSSHRQPLTVSRISFCSEPHLFQQLKTDGMRSRFFVQSSSSTRSGFVKNRSLVNRDGRNRSQEKINTRWTGTFAGRTLLTSSLKIDVTLITFNTYLHREQML
ncbi:hypothetical protein BDZ89DRAFT_310528 [Hymenopellis radicata]|nr:hypothetical protein BDZ89DRAFT_310528 [Hymenopellis radicata]